MTEREKMINGARVRSIRSGTGAITLECTQIGKNVQPTDEDQPEEQAEILQKLLPATKQLPYLQAPIYFDYGCNTYFGKYSSANFNFTCLDVCEVHIGDNVMIGPNVTLATSHASAFAGRTEYPKSEKMEASIIWNMPNPSP